MNLEALYELKERLEASAIAGVSLVSEDFRLARAIENVEPLAKASPVFDKIFKGAKAVMEAAPDERAAALLDVLALVDAVLTTQAVTGKAEITEEIQSETGKITYIEAPYGRLAPLLEALTTTGSGHYNTVVDTHNDNPEIFKDYRVKNALVKGLGAGYAELADKVEEWLKQEDKSVIPLLKKDFDPKGKKEMLRRLEVIEHIAGSDENEFYRTVLEDAVKEIRETAIYALRHDTANQELLEVLAKTEKGKCKKTALCALAKLKTDECSEVFMPILKKKPAEAFEYFMYSENAAISDIVAGEVNNMIDDIKEKLSQGEYEADNDEKEKYSLLIETMKGKTSDKIIETFRRLAATVHELEEDRKVISFATNNFIRTGTGLTKKYISELLSMSIIMTKNERLIELAEEFYKEYGKWYINPYLTGLMLTKPAKEVYDRFADVFDKEPKTIGPLSEMVTDTFEMLEWDANAGAYTFKVSELDMCISRSMEFAAKVYEKPDIRWFDCITDRKIYRKSNSSQSSYYASSFVGWRRTEWNRIVTMLICPEDEQICERIGRFFYNKAYMEKNISKYIYSMNKCGYKKAKGLVIKTMENSTMQFYGFRHTMLEAPMSKAEKLEEFNEIRELIKEGKLNIKGYGYDEQRLDALYEELLELPE